MGWVVVLELELYIHRRARNHQLTGCEITLKSSYYQNIMTGFEIIECSVSNLKSRATMKSKQMPFATSSAHSPVVMLQGWSLLLDKIVLYP